MIPEIQIRRLAPADAAAYRQIRLEALQLSPESFSAQYNEQHLKPKLSFEIDIENSEPTRFIIGAFDKEKLIGIFGFALSNTYNLENTGTLIQMYIQKEYRGRGIGVRLTVFTVQSAWEAGARNVVLDVKSNNFSARKVYEKSGFSLIDKSQLSDGILDENLDVMAIKPIRHSQRA